MSVFAATSSAYALSPGDRTIVAFGDSTTIARPEFSVYADLLYDELPPHGINADVINQGIGGNNTGHAMARFQADVLDQNPDLVIMQFGINDSMVDVWMTPPATQPRVPLATYTSNLTNMVQTLKNAGSDVILMTPNPLRWTPELLGLYGQTPYDPNDPMGLNATIVEYAQAVRDIAAAKQVPLIDVYNLFVQYDQTAGQSMDDLLLDGMHPNAAGHRMVADALIATITPEPATMSLLLCGAAGVILRKRR